MDKSGEREGYGPEMNRKQGPPKLKGQRGQLLHWSLGHPVCVEGRGEAGEGEVWCRT